MKLQEREHANHDLQCALKLIILLLRLNVSEEKCQLFESAISFTTQLRTDDLVRKNKYYDFEILFYKPVRF